MKSTNFLLYVLEQAIKAVFQSQGDLLYRETLLPPEARLPGHEYQQQRDDHTTVAHVLWKAAVRIEDEEIRMLNNMEAL